VSDGGFGLLLEIEHSEESLVAFADVSVVLARQTREVSQVLFDREPPVRVPGTFQHCPDVPGDFGGVFGDIDPVDLDRAFVLLNEPQEHFDRRRLPGTVWAEQSDTRAAFDRERDAIDCRYGFAPAVERFS
jgi:hypothetical protein